MNSFSNRLAHKTIFIAVTTFLLTIVSSSNAEGPGGEGLLDKSCTADKDCVSLPEVWNGCWSHCEGDQCNGAPVCEVVNKVKTEAKGPFPLCIRNVPCKKPEIIRCEDKECKAS